MRMLRNMPRLVVGALILLLGIAQPALAEVFCVATAVDLQNALIRAAANGQDDEVRIVQDTYVGNFVYASTEAQALSVLGGYTAGCAGRTLDPANTILDGNLTGTVLKLSASTVAAEFVVEGLTLRKGTSSGLRAEVGSGGEVLVDHNFITGNTASNGGGVYLSATTATLTNNDISGNTASSYSSSYGGGVYLSATTATLTNNDISGNTASAYYSSYGGGVYLSATSATLTNNGISGNTASTSISSYSSSSSSYGGGVYLSATSATLTNNGISGNTASSYSSASTSTSSSLSSYGGGVYLSVTTATLTNNDISGNTASSSYTYSYSYGGGVYLSATTATLTNNDISGNSATASSSSGGGLYFQFKSSEPNSSVALFNNLFWLNQATRGADFNINNTTASQVNLLANNFDWTPTTGFWVGTPVYIDASNLNKLAPLFVDASTGDRHLQPGSPMIDAGYPATPDLPDFDIAGIPRVLGNSVDIGAYEFDDNSDPKAILSLTLAGTGSGTVTSNPIGINCGSDCFQAYPLDTPVTLTATPADANSVFAGWSGQEDCADGQVTMAANLSCTATFSTVRQLTVTRAGDGSGRVTSIPTGIDCGAACAAYFYQGEAVALTATPDAISIFGSWSGDAICPHPVLTVDRACTANFAPLLYRLYLFVYGTGGGSVTSAPAGITCGTDCEEDYRATTVVTLTAAPDANSDFWGWTGPCTGAEPTCEVTLSAISGLAAIFNLKTYPLSVTKAGTGTGTVTSAPGSINCGTHCSEAFDHGATVTLTASPEASSTFSGWSGACTGAESCQVTLEEARSVTATFALKRHTVTATAGANGAIDPLTRDLDHGTTTTFTVTPTTGYSASVSGCGGTLAGNIYTTGPITAACTVTATFTLNSYTLTTAVSPAGAGLVNCTATTIGYGGASTCTATAHAGYSFGFWSGDCAGATCALTNITSNKSVTANFARNSYALSVTKAGTGTGTVASDPEAIDCGTNCQETFEHGVTVTLTATPDATATFTGWSGDCTGAEVCRVDMEEARSVTAAFAPITYTVTATAGPNGGISPASQSVAHGATTTFTVTPDPSYTASATGCGGSLANGTYTTGVIAGDCTVSASFSPIPAEEDLTLADLQVTTEASYQAAGVITVTGTVGVQPGGSLNLQAGRSIRFLPGFQVGAGGTLKAGILPSL